MRLAAGSRTGGGLRAPGAVGMLALLTVGLATPAPARALELLATDEHHLHGVMVLAGPADTALVNLVGELRSRRLAKRVILQVIGGNADQIDTRVLESADLVLPGNAEETVLLKKLDQLFSAESRP